MREIELTSGGVSRVSRVGTTVRRPAARWTPAVRALPRRLATEGFKGGAAWARLDERGREVLDFLPGEVSQEPLAEEAPHWGVAYAA